MDEDELLDQIRNHDATEEAPPVAPAPLPPKKQGNGELKRFALIGAVCLGLGGAVALLLSGTGASEAFVYSKMVDEVMSSPDDFVGRELRVEGELRRGSIEFEDEPSCEHTFVLQRGEEEMHVRFPRCVVPDTFRDDMPMPVNVVVQGQLQPNGTFLADQVIPRCASHYDGTKNGQQAPHAVPPSSS